MYKRIRAIEGMRGKAVLYELDEAITYRGNNDEDEKTNFVIVSAVVAPYTGPETYIFPSNEAGAIVDWCEISGSYRGGLCHTKAMEGLMRSIEKHASDEETY